MQKFAAFSHAISMAGRILAEQDHQKKNIGESSTKEDITVQFMQKMLDMSMRNLDSGPSFFKDLYFKDSNFTN